MNFENKVNEKALIITLEGFAATETAENFVHLLKSEVAKVNPLNYSLIIDSTNLLAFKPDILPILEKCYQLYMSFGFRKIFMINPKQITAKMQLQRVARSSKFTGIFLNTLEEAITEAKS